MKKITFFSFFIIVSLTGCSNALAEKEGFKTMASSNQNEKVAPKPHGHPDHEKIKHESVEYTGKVLSFSANPDKAYDAFVIDAKNTQTRVKFPPHMAKKIMDTLKTGDTVTVSGDLHTKPDNTKEVHFKKFSKGNTEITNEKPGFKLPSLSSQPTTTVEGTIKEFRKGPKGDINGAYLNDGTIVHMPPKESETLSAMLKVGDKIKVTGSLKPTDEEGFVYTEKVKIIKADSVNFNNKDYSLKK